MVRTALTGSSSAYELTHLFKYFGCFLDARPHLILELRDEGQVYMVLICSPMTSIYVGLFRFLEDWSQLNRLGLSFKVLLEFRQEMVLGLQQWNRLIKYFLLVF